MHAILELDWAFPDPIPCPQTCQIVQEVTLTTGEK